MTMTIEHTAAPAVPADIIESFALPDALPEQLSGGLVNQTYRIGDFILQRLGHTTDHRSVNDGVAVMQYMTARGWQVPCPLAGSNGEYAQADTAGNLWRASSFVESDNVVPDYLDQSGLYRSGQLLGRWHRDLANSNIELQAATDNVHDTAMHAGRLACLYADLPDDTTKRAADTLLSRYDSLPSLPDTPQQLIHGDPKLANMLFQDSQPFTLIDYDTLMHGSPWLDVGDMLRSIASCDIRAGQNTELGRLHTALQGYTETVENASDRDILQTTGLAATKIIATELAIRYLNDIVTEDYFSWDSSRAGSRQEHHMGRIAVHLQITDAIQI